MVHSSVHDSLTTGPRGSIPTLVPLQCLLGGNTTTLHVQGHAARLLQGHSTKVLKRARLGDEALSFQRGKLRPNTWRPKYVLVGPSLSVSYLLYLVSLCIVSVIVSRFL